MKNYNLNVEEIKKEAKLIDKVKSELLALDNIADFTKDDPRMDIVAFQGVGRIFYECKNYDNKQKLLNDIKKIINKYYTIIEDFIKDDSLYTTFYFKYDCSDDGVNEVFV